VALEVVDALEVVEVDDHAGQRVLVAARAGDLLADADLHRAVVEEAGQRIGASGLLEALVGLGVAAADDGQVGHRLEHAQVLVVGGAGVCEAHPQRAADLVVPDEGQDDGVVGNRAVELDAGRLGADGARGLVGQLGERLRQPRREVQRPGGASERANGPREARRRGGCGFLGLGFEHGSRARRLHRLRRDAA
jgi:hypothetical protein